jgi:hypothetical protein
MSRTTDKSLHRQSPAMRVTCAVVCTDSVAVLRRIVPVQVAG